MNVQLHSHLVDGVVRLASRGGCGFSWVEVGARPVPTSRIDWCGVAVLASQGPRAPLQHPGDLLTHHPVRAQQPSRTLTTFHFPCR